MDFNSPATLGFYSSVKIASILFCRQDLFHLEQKQLHLVGWVQVQENVTQLVQALQLPKNIEESVQELIQPVGDQIRRWLSNRAFVTRDKVDLYNKFSWTAHGMIDYKSTAEKLIESTELDLPTKFTLACLDAVEDYAKFVISDICVTKMLLDSNSIPRCKRDSKVYHECLLMINYLLTERCKNEISTHCPPTKPGFYESVVKKLVKNGNTSLTRYFLTKIEQNKRMSFVRQEIVNMLESNNRFVNLDTLLFLLFQMDNDQIKKLFIENTEHVLLRFLEWPLQRHFMKLASKLWNAMTTVTFNSILQAIVVHIIQYYSLSTNPFGYRDIFREFWMASPAEYRRVCMNELIVPILSSLFRSHGYFNTMLHLFGDESYHQKLETLFFSNADAVLEILSNENKAKAFESIILRYFSPNDIQLDFGEKYNVYTQKYLESYYGEIEMGD